MPASTTALYLIGTVSADTLTLSPEDRLTDAVPASGVSLRSGDTITRNTGSWLADGFEAGADHRDHRSRGQ